MAINYEYFKKKLEEEKGRVEKELEEVGRRNPDNPSDWEATAEESRMHADENIAADEIEEYDKNLAITNTLERRYNDIKSGLDKIEQSTYGTCEVCNKEIELDRLEANPAARTCKEHVDTPV